MGKSLVSCFFETVYNRNQGRRCPGEGECSDTSYTLVYTSKTRKTTHGLDGQYQDVDRTLRGRVNQNDRGQG